LDSTAGKKEAGATLAVGGMARLHSGGVTEDRPELGSGGQGITAGWPEVRGRIGELVLSLTEGWAVARRLGDETARWCGEDWGGEGAFYRPGWSIGEAVMAGVGGQTRVL
jgi:hypothetical protein